MTYDIIGRLNDTTIASKQELISFLIKRAEKNKPNEQFQSPILDFLSEREKSSYLSAFYLIGPKYALGCLVGHFVYHYISERDFIKQVELLKTLSDYLKELSLSRNA